MEENRILKIKKLKKYRYKIEEHTEIMEAIIEGREFTVVEDHGDLFKLSTESVVEFPWVLRSEIEGF